MNKTNRILLFALASMLFAYCGKDHEEPVNETPPTVISKKSTTTFTSDGVTSKSSAEYEYNEQRQIVRCTYPENGSYLLFLYEGDLIKSYSHYQKDGTLVRTVSNYMQRVGNGNTIFCDLTESNAGAGVDTAHIYYTFEGDQLKSIRRYIHGWIYERETTLDELVTYTYDTAANLTNIDIERPGSEFHHTVIANDGKKNPYRLMPPATFIYLMGSDDASLGASNPLQIDGPNSSMKYKWTYYGSGYPRTMTRTLEKYAGFIGGGGKDQVTFEYK